MQIVATDDVAGDAAAWLADRLEQLTGTGRRASLAVSGGTTPWAALERLGKANLRWPQIDVYQVDERVVPADSAERNWRAVRQTLLGRLPAIGHPMPVEETDLDAAAERYAAELPETLDIVQLGLGADGHTASLVPGDPVLDVADRDVTPTGPYQGNRRMTLTFPALNRAAAIMWIVTGTAKREALAALIDGDRSIPAGRIARDRAILFADRDALGDSARQL